MNLKSEYLNTDLDLISSNDLTKLGDFFEKNAFLLNCDKSSDDKWCLRVEGDESGLSNSADQDMAEWGIRFRITTYPKKER